MNKIEIDASVFAVVCFVGGLILCVLFGVATSGSYNSGRMDEREAMRFYTQQQSGASR